MLARASSKSSHRGGRRLGSKETSLPAALAMRAAAKVAFRTPSWVQETVPK